MEVREHNKFEDLIYRKGTEHGAKFSIEDLADKFIPYYNSGERIKVRVGSSIYHGTVGVTTGWKPCFLLMTRRTAIGSSICLDPCDEVLAVKRGNKYIPVASNWESRVQALENEGLTRSDAQAVVDAEDLREGGK
jgi:hypothetical protein